MYQYRYLQSICVIFNNMGSNLNMKHFIGIRNCFLNIWNFIGIAKLMNIQVDWVDFMICIVQLRPFSHACLEHCYQIARWLKGLSARLLVFNQLPLNLPLSHTWLFLQVFSFLTIQKNNFLLKVSVFLLFFLLSFLLSPIIFGGFSAWSIRSCRRILFWFTLVFFFRFLIVLKIKLLLLFAKLYLVKLNIQFWMILVCQT